MELKLTDEQLDIVSAINSKRHKIVASEANAGSSKSFVIKASLTYPTNPYKSALILAFNAKISKENQGLFPDWCDCRTIHSLAYKYVVAPLKLSIKPNVNIFDIKVGSKISKEMSVKNINNFCMSGCSTVREYLDLTTYSAHFKSTISRDIKQVISDMENGDIPISHGVYIKLFQLHLLHREINVEKFEFLFADEFQDFNGCMYSIFMSLDIPNKAVAFDSKQQIYGWAGAINATELIKQEDGVKLLSLSRSFRCSTEIAEPVNEFCNNYMQDDMSFEGSFRTKEDISKLETFGYQFRTNKSMILAMLGYKKDGIKFTLARNINAILGELIYVMVGARKEYEYRLANANQKSEHFREENIPIYHEFEMYKATNSNSKISFSFWLANTLKDKESDVNKTVARIGYSAKSFKLSDILSLREYCVDRKNRDKNFTIMTAFSAKGLSIDCVMIDDTLNDWTLEAIEDDMSDEEELYLYYVACTRAKKCLINAKLLKGGFYGSVLDKYDFDRFVKESQSLTVPKGL